MGIKLSSFFFTIACCCIAVTLDHGQIAFAQASESKKTDHGYQCSARFHLQEGSRKGYLVVQVKMKPGLSIYSVKKSKPNRLSKGADDRPSTKIVVSKTKLLTQVGDFSPDKPAKRANDPYLGKIDKHTGVVQFFAPIELSTLADLKKDKLTIRLNGLICDQQSCLPIDKELSAKFAGYFHAKPKAAKRKQPVTGQRR